jgi:hypothetical protein
MNSIVSTIYPSKPTIDALQIISWNSTNSRNEYFFSCLNSSITDIIEYMKIVSICLRDKYSSPGLFIFEKNIIAAFKENPFLPLSSNYFA